MLCGVAVSKAKAMRSFTFGLLVTLALGGVSASQAADLDYGTLRGPDYEPELQTIDWSGVYLGAHGGSTSAAFNFQNVFQPIVANALRASTTETQLNASSLLAPYPVRKAGASYGAFAGYNAQFDETVLGLEFDYTRFDLSGAATDTIARFNTGSDGYYNAVYLKGESSTKVADYGTIRARAGYALGSFLPFITGGFAIGRAEVADHVAIQAYGYDKATYEKNQAITDGSKPAYVNRYGYQTFDPNAPGNGTPLAPVTYGKTSIKTVAGVALGAGLEYAITSNIILRGEYQYVLFNDFDGHKVNLNTVRGGAAVKF